MREEYNISRRSSTIRNRVITNIDKQHSSLQIWPQMVFRSILKSHFFIRLGFFLHLLLCTFWLCLQVEHNTRQSRAFAANNMSRMRVLVNMTRNNRTLTNSIRRTSKEIYVPYSHTFEVQIMNTVAGHSLVQIHTSYFQCRPHGL